MKKSILFLLALFSVTMTTQATDYYYRGEKNSWGAGQKLEVSTDTYYSYIHFDAGAEHQFKICEHATDWNQPNYGKDYNDVGFNGTDVTELGDHWGGDNCKIWYGKAHYVLVYHPNTKINTTNKVKICASTFLPDDSETDLPEPEPEPTELTYNVTVPAGTNVCYICGNMTDWKFTEMTKVDDTHYTITIEGAKKDDGYKYASGSDWGYVEKDANGNEMGNRKWAENDVVAKWASVYNPDAVEQELTYSVTVPEGTYACYIAMDTDPAQDGWEFNEMTKVDDTHYTFTRTGLKNKTYKYASGPSWDYVEKTSENGDVADRQWAENDVVAKWASVYNPSVPTYDYYIAGTLPGAAWSATSLGMTKDGDVYKHTFTELNPDIYEFKITAGDWEHQWNYSNLGAAYEEVSQGVDGEGNPNGNIKIVTEEAKNITVIFDATAGKITLEGLTEKVVVISYVLMGVAGDWTTGIAMTQNPDNANEYVLLGQEIAEGDAVKVVTLVNGVAEAYCGAVEKASPVKFEFDNDGNIVLLPGKYDFYFKVNDPTTDEDDAMYIAGEANPVDPEVPTALDNVDTTVAPAKAIVNGQLVITKDGVQYNAQGAILK